MDAPILHRGDRIHLEFPHGLTPSDRDALIADFKNQGVEVSICTYGVEGLLRVVAVFRDDMLSAMMTGSSDRLTREYADRIFPCGETAHHFPHLRDTVWDHQAQCPGDNNVKIFCPGVRRESQA